MLRYALPTHQKIILFFVCWILNMGISSAQLDTILIDLGNGNASNLPWNNLLNANNAVINDLTDAQGFSTGFSIEVTDGFTGTNTNGTTNPNPAIGFPVSATEDSFFGNTNMFNGGINPTAAVTLSNLNPNQEYHIELFASRLANDNRETQYVVDGASSNTYFLQVSSNTSSVVQATAFPDATGTITITTSPGPNNDNAFGFYYLGAMKLMYPSQNLMPNLSLVSPVGGEFWQVGKTPSITWNSQGITTVNIDYSIDNGLSWFSLGTQNALAQSYDWIVPNTPSTNCLVRVNGGGFTIQSPSVFEISSTQDDCHIVVLGSSTAAGTGPTSPDSTWVNRYSKAIFQQNTRYTLTNLALGGQTTYNIVPDGAVVPAGFTINPNRNLTAALALNPSAIIVNMPSNDAANNISTEEQLFNFDLIQSVAACEGVETWICTTQPRNNFNAAQVQIQKEVRDSVLSKYGTYALDFWTGFATANDSIVSIYDSGDGVHLNDAAHRVLYERVFNKNIHQIDCSNSSIQQSTITHTFADWEIDYHAGNPYIDVVFETISNASIELELFDINGNTINTYNQNINSAGTHMVTWNAPIAAGTPQQYLFIQITIIDDNGIKKGNLDLGCKDLNQHFYRITVE